MEPVLLPPGLVGLALLVWLVVLLMRRRRREATIVLVVFGVYYLVATWPVGYVVVSALERGPWPERTWESYHGAEAIVVLAGAATSGEASWREGELNEASWRRLWRGVEVYYGLGGSVPIVFSGGAGTNESADAADPAAKAARWWGVGPDQFWLERYSTSTYESGQEVKRILDARFPLVKTHSIVLVTSAWHMPRAGAVFAKQGMEVIEEPCDFLALKPAGMIASLVPNYGAFSTLTVAMREWFTMGVYGLLGRI